MLIAVSIAATGLASAQIVALGHSAVRGGVAENEMWPAVLEGMLRARGSQLHVTNAGVWGETIKATLARLSGTGKSKSSKLRKAKREAAASQLEEEMADLRREVAGVKDQLERFRKQFE